MELDKKIFKNRNKLKKFNEIFGWRVAPHVADITWKLECLDVGTTLGVSEPRQNFKTETAVIFLFDGAIQGESGVFFGHNGDIIREAIKRMAQVCRLLESEGIVSRINDHHGFQQISFSNGAEVYFRIRTAGSTVGLSVDRIVFDEAQKLTSNFLEDASATLKQSKVKKILMIGTPPKDEDYKNAPDGPFLQLKKNGGEHWIEFSAADDYSPEIETSLDNTKKANPSWRLTPGFSDYYRQQLALLDHEAFCRQVLGVWKLPKGVKEHDPYFTQSEVKSFLSSRGSRATTFWASLGIYPDSEKAFVAMSDGQIVEVAERFSVENGQLDELVEWIRGHGRQMKALYIPGNARGQTVDLLLKDARWMKGRQVKLPEAAVKIGRFLKQLKDSDLKVFEAEDSRVALSSFWLGFDARSGSAILEAATPEDRSLVLSLALCSQVKNDRLNRSDSKEQNESNDKQWDLSF